MSKKWDDTDDHTHSDGLPAADPEQLKGLRPFTISFGDGVTVWAKSREDAVSAAECITNGHPEYEHFEGLRYDIKREPVPNEMHDFDKIFLGEDEDEPENTFADAYDLKREDREAIVAAAKAIEEAEAPRSAVPTPAGSTGDLAPEMTLIEWKSPPLWVEGDRVTVFDVTDSMADDLLGFVGVKCEVVSLPDPEDPDSMVRVRHANGLLGDFWPEELAPVGTPPTKRALAAIAEQSSPGRRPVSLAYALARVQSWQAKTFGESSPMEARADKMLDEAREVAEAVAALVAAGIGNEANRKRVLAELGDVCFLVADLLRGLGASTGELVSAILGNLAKNEQDNWKADATGKYSRVKPAKASD